jgi:hypothetical protein
VQWRCIGVAADVKSLPRYRCDRYYQCHCMFPLQQAIVGPVWYHPRGSQACSLNHLHVTRNIPIPRYLDTSIPRYLTLNQLFNSHWPSPIALPSAPRAARIHTHATLPPPFSLSSSMPSVIFPQTHFFQIKASAHRLFLVAHPFALHL